MSDAIDIRPIIREAEAYLNDEHSQGYTDGRDIDAPEASTNRSDAYRHSFEVGRAERRGEPIPAWKSRVRVDSIRNSEITRRLQMLPRAASNPDPLS